MVGKEILIIDDELMFVEPVKMILERNGATVFWVSDGLKGFNQARSSPPDLIILDLMLPGMNGYQICRLLKHDSNFKTIPIVIVSAKDTDQEINLANECGADLYITKPIDYNKLVQEVKRVI